MCVYNIYTYRVCVCVCLRVCFYIVYVETGEQAFQDLVFRAMVSYWPVAFQVG